MPMPDCNERIPSPICDRLLQEADLGAFEPFTRRRATPVADHRDARIEALEKRIADLEKRLEIQESRFLGANPLTDPFNNFPELIMARNGKVIETRTGREMELVSR